MKRNNVQNWDLGIENYPANIYLFKVNNRNTRKGVKYVQS